MGKRPRYGLIAPFYDLLARVIFGNRLRRAKFQELPWMVNCQHILIIGGGSGEELEELERLRFKGKVTFLEPSPVIEKAKKRVCSYDVTFLKEYWPLTLKEAPDGIITAFFLDQFNGSEFQEMVRSIKSCLSHEGKWLIVDFLPPRNWRENLLYDAMKVFFWFTTGLKGATIHSPQTLLKIAQENEVVVVLPGLLDK